MGRLFKCHSIWLDKFFLFNLWFCLPPTDSFVLDVPSVTALELVLFVYLSWTWGTSVIKFAVVD